MNAQQISLNLVAQLDQGNIQSQATQMAMNMARAIEDAFQGIGTQIAASILAGVRQGLQGSVEMLGQARIGAGGASLPVTETERQIMASRATAPRGIFTPEGDFRPVGQQPAPHAEPVVPPTAPQPPPLQTPTPPVGAQPTGPQPGQTEEPATEGGFVMTRGMRTNISKGFGAAGTILEFLGELPAIQRRAEASRAEVTNLEARTAMRGDIEQMTAIQRLGGQDQLQTRAAREEGLIIAGEVAGAIGLAFAPVTGGLSLLLGAAALGVGTDAIRRTVGFNTRVEQNVMGQTEAERKRNEEVYNFLQRGRETAIQGFQAARQSGAPELSGMMAGGLDANLPRNALATARGRLAELEGSPTAMSPNEGERNRNLQEQAQLRERIRDLEQQANRADPFMVTSQGRNTSLRQFAAQFGIGEQEFMQTMQQTGAGMGGVFLGQQPRLEQMPNQIAELIRLQGIGLPNAAGLAGQLFQGGGMSRTESIETVKQMFEDAVSAGMDKAQVGRALTEMATRAGQLGFGGGGAAAAELTRGMGLAQAAFGEAGTVEGPEMRFAQQINQQLTQAGRSQTADLGKMGGQEGVGRFARRFRGLRLDRFAQMELQETAQDQGSLEKFLREHGAREEDIQSAEQQGNLATQLESEKQRGIFDVTRRALGSDEAATQYMRRTLGVQTGAGMERFRQLQKIIKAGQGTQPQIYTDMNDQTGELFTKAQAPSGLQEQIGMNADGTPVMRNVPTIEAGAKVAQGADQARALAQIDATQISAGLGDLNQVLPIVNLALSRLVERANAVLAGNTGANTAATAGATAAPGSAVSSAGLETLESILSGQSSTMSSRKAPNASFVPGRAPRS